MKKKIGLLAAVVGEVDAVLRRFGTAERSETRHGFEVFVYDMGAYELYVIHSGAGQIAAAAAVQMLIDRYEVELLVNFGVVGGLTEEMSQTKTCLVERVVHYDFDTSAIDDVPPGQYCQYPDLFLRPSPALVARAKEICPEFKLVTCASGDKFVAGEDAKRALQQRWGADICEMEAAAVVLTCDRCGIPCLLIKTVSDGLTQAGEDYYPALSRTSALCLEVADKIIREL